MRAILVSLLLASPLLAQQIAEVEPNDTLAAAQLVAAGAQVDAELLVGEVDWFRFVTTGGYMRLAVTAAIDTQMELWDATGANCLAFNDDGQGLQSSVWMNLAAGAYHLKVEGFSATTGGSYALEVSLPGVRPLTQSEVEPNDALATATVVAGGAQVGASLRPPIAVLTGVAGATNTTTVTQSTTALIANQYADGRHWLRYTAGANTGQERRISANTTADMTMATGFSSTPAPGDAFVVMEYDADWFRFDVASPRALVAFSITDGDDRWLSGFSYQLLDASGTQVSSVYGVGNAESDAYLNRLTSFRVLTAGAWYVRVFHRRTALSGPPAVAPLHGNYRFELQVRDMNVGGVAVEAAEPNNTVARATPIAPGQQGRGVVTTGTDTVDLWGPIAVPTQALLCVQTDAGATAPALLDSTINLRQLTDPATGALGAATAATTGNTLNTTAGASHARGTYQLLLPNTVYYVEVVSPGSAATQSGSYVLELSLLDAPPYAAGTVVTTAANAAGCGTAGVPTIGRAFATELPILGQAFVTRTSNLNGPGNLGLMVLGLSGAQGPSGAPAGSPQSIYNPQPLALTLLGAPGCTLNVSPLQTDVLLADPGTLAADYVLPIPGAPGLQGFTLFLQPAKLDFLTPANALGVQPGNWMRIVVGTRAF
jgi:hypothetical protein